LMDVVVVGAGPTGLMLAGELGQAAVRTLLLERRPEPSEMGKAAGLAGQILQLLHYRGELDRFRELSIGPGRPEPAPRFPFGGLHLDFSGLEDSPMRAMLLPSPGWKVRSSNARSSVGPTYAVDTRWWACAKTTTR
jgi:2-polyprenyl-6-methoxyphenol hydroxylase-like FAD-dependent oxidoreductase